MDVPILISVSAPTPNVREKVPKTNTICVHTKWRGHKSRCKVTSPVRGFEILPLPPSPTAFSLLTTGILIGQHTVIWMTLTNRKPPSPYYQQCEERKPWGISNPWTGKSASLRFWQQAWGEGEGGGPVDGWRCGETKAMGEEGARAADFHSWRNPSCRDLSCSAPMWTPGTKSLWPARLHTGSVRETTCDSDRNRTTFLFKSHAICTHSFSMDANYRYSVSANTWPNVFVDLKKKKSIGASLIESELKAALKVRELLGGGDKTRISAQASLPLTVIILLQNLFKKFWLITFVAFIFILFFKRNPSWEK